MSPVSDKHYTVNILNNYRMKYHTLYWYQLHFDTMWLCFWSLHMDKQRTWQLGDYYGETRQWIWVTKHVSFIITNSLVLSKGLQGLMIQFLSPCCPVCHLISAYTRDVHVTACVFHPVINLINFTQLKYDNLGRCVELLRKCTKQLYKIIWHYTWYIYVCISYFARYTCYDKCNWIRASKCAIWNKKVSGQALESSLLVLSTLLVPLQENACSV